MKIAQVAPLAESVPPKFYGGTERIVSYLTEELVRQGHQVTLFASGDSQTAARLIPCCEEALRLDERVHDRLVHHVYMLERVIQMASEFDVIHYHIDYLHFPLSRRILTPSVTTLHGRLDRPDIFPLYREFAEMPLVSISDSQRTPLAEANWVGTVYHGLPESLYQFHSGPGKYLAFLGRMSREKRPDRAIEIAKAVGTPIKFAAKVDKQDREFFESTVKPKMDGPLIEFIGEIGEKDKNEFLGNALALLFPIDWPEPFGLVMIESLACGTPVVAFASGSVPEIIEHGKTGYVVHTIEEGIEATREALSLDRRVCRQEFERRFTVQRMVEDYVRIYQGLREPLDVKPILGAGPGIQERLSA